uniref:Putative serine/threonine kinase n=1 Tax=Xenopsylla cheopis TaxID=163159 RepID=A0A6M2DZR5_XENCH
MWSLGVICYVLLSGLSPFMGDNDAETFANVTRAEFDFDDAAFESVSQDARDFVSSLLIKQLEKRASPEDCLNSPWLRSIGSRPVGTRLRTDRLKKFVVRRKWQLGKMYTDPRRTA